MDTKLFEIRDAGTFVPVMCTLMHSENKSEKYLLERVGYVDSNLVMMTILTNNQTKYDFMAWNDRTFQNAHKHIKSFWNMLETGAVVDVEFILGEAEYSKTSERLESEK